MFLIEVENIDQLM